MPEDIFPRATREVAAKRKALAPDIHDAFTAFSERVFADGALPAKTRQLIAAAAAHITRNVPSCLSTGSLLFGFNAFLWPLPSRPRRSSRSAIGCPKANHRPNVVGIMAAHVALEWVHQAFALLKRWALGVYHGLRRRHIQRDLEEFTFRFNRRRSGPATFHLLVGIAGRTASVTYRGIVAGGSEIIPRQPLPPAKPGSLRLGRAPA